MLVKELTANRHSSVSASKKEWLVKNAAAEKQKLAELIKDLKGNPVSDAVQEMKSMKIDESMIQKVQEKLETDARDNVLSVMGHAGYETYD